MNSSVKLVSSGKTYYNPRFSAVGINHLFPKPIGQHLKNPIYFYCPEQASHRAPTSPHHLCTKASCISKFSYSRGAIPLSRLHSKHAWPGIKSKPQPFCPSRICGMCCCSQLDKARAPKNKLGFFWVDSSESDVWTRRYRGRDVHFLVKANGSIEAAAEPPQ